MGDIVDDLEILDDPKVLTQKIATRFVLFSKAFDVFNQRLIQRNIDIFYMSNPLLMIAVKSYFHDIRRLKSFHHMTRADHFKIAGYSTKWLSKVRPIQVQKVDARDEARLNRIAFVNSEFALMQGLNFANVDINGIGDLAENIMYDCCYRDIDGGIMAQLYKALHMTAPRKGSRAGASRN